MRTAVLTLATSILAAGAAGLAGPIDQAGTGGRPSAADLASRLQARYAAIRDFTASFSQTYDSGLLRLDSNAPERGDLKLKKPNRFRMVYRSPERKEFVADGRTLKSYFPADRIGREDALPEPGSASTALLFVAGRGDLVRDFTATLPAEQVDGEWRLDLKPKARQADFEILTLVVQRSTLKLVGFGWTESGGGTSLIRLTNLRENTNVPDSDFRFEFPRGTVIERE